MRSIKLILCAAGVLVLGMSLLTGCVKSEILYEVPQTYAVERLTETSSLEEEKISLLDEQAGHFAYDSLTEAEQLWYRDVEQILGTMEEKGRLSAEGQRNGLNETHVDKIFQCVMNDHPELFYVEGYTYTKYTKGDALVAVEFSGTYGMDMEKALARKEEIEQAAASLLAGVELTDSDYHKIKYVYDTLIGNTDYELNAPDNQNIYSVFVGHASVCQGYAKACQYLLNHLGVECTLAMGTVDTGEGHAWNLVRADGDYYYVDTTWGDASYQMEDNDTGADTGAYMPDINYDYLCVTTAELLRTHTLGGCVPMPECVATKDNYYVREGALFTSYDREQMKTLFDRALQQEQTDITIKCTDLNCFQEIQTAMIENQEVFDYFQVHSGSIAYAHNEKQLSLTFWVTNE